MRSLRTRSLMHVRQPTFIHPVLFYDVLPHVLFYCFIQLMCNYLINEGSQDTSSAAKIRNKTGIFPSDAILPHLRSFI